MSCIIWNKELDSTNLELRRRMSELDNLSVIAAEWQSAGRGQRGNRWLSDKGENLTFSIVLKYGLPPLPHLQARKQHAVSMVTTLALTRFLQGMGISANVKWPNDIYVADRKICGMLIEHVLQGGENIKYSIIGIGLNVRQREFSPSLPNPSSIAIETGRDNLDCHELLNEFMSIFEECLPMLEDMKQLEELFLKDLWRKDELHEFIDCRSEFEKPFYGRIRSINDCFQLLVENEKGELEQFSFKDIKYVL